jgi:hypothetical protein
MFSKIKLDGGSIMAVMGSTSEKMYLCEVPNFGFLNDKAETGRVTCMRRESLGAVSPCESIKDRLDVGLMIEDLFNWSHASSWVSFASGRLIPERPTHNGSGEMARVACTLHGTRLDGGVSVLSVGVNPFWS